MLTIELKGRIDTANALVVEKEIEEQITADAVTGLVFDCKELKYISSTGLRIILKYKKMYDNLELANVSADVYSVFEMTGFSRIMTIRKALRRISIAGCPEIARGGVGIIYRLDNDTIIKVFPADCGMEIPERERKMAQEAFVLGMPTAIPYDIVLVEETGSYGLVTELIAAGTLGAAINQDRENYRHYARMFGELLRNMHSIKVPQDTLPDAIGIQTGDIDRIACHFKPEQVELMKFILSKIPQGNSLLHNDCHPKNVMIKGEPGNQELILIDMGEVSYGNPLVELSHTSSTFHMGDGFEQIVGFPESMSGDFWLEMLKAYLGTEDESVVNEYDRIISAAAIVRSISWVALGSFPQEVIDGVRKIADERLWPNRDYYISMANRFAEYFPGS